MTGTPLSSFGDFVLATPPSIASGPEAIINDAVRNKYLLNRLLSGDMRDHLQGGEYIEDQILLETKPLAQNYHPNVSVTYDNPQVINAHKADWKFTGTHMMWTDQEVGLNNGGNATRVKWKDIKRKIQQHAWTELMNFMEDDCWATPSYAGMEYDQGGRDPYSIPCFVNEFPNGTPYGWTNDDIMGLSGATHAGWRPYQDTYSMLGDATAAGTGNHLFSAFDRCVKRISFDRLPVKPTYSDGASQAGFIACSIDGCAELESALRKSQDYFRGSGITQGQDAAYPDPQYMGIPVLYFDGLDGSTAVGSVDGAYLYNNVGGGAATDFMCEHGVNSDGTTAGVAGWAGPRYYFINPKYMKKVIHSERYFFQTPPERMVAGGQPTNHVIWVDVWHQNWCASRKRHGLIGPAADMEETANDATKDWQA